MKHVMKNMILCAIVSALALIWTGSACFADGGKIYDVHTYAELVKACGDATADEIRIVPNADFGWPGVATTVVLPQNTVINMYGTTRFIVKGTWTIPSNVTILQNASDVKAQSPIIVDGGTYVYSHAQEADHYYSSSLLNMSVKNGGTLKIGPDGMTGEDRCTIVLNNRGSLQIGDNSRLVINGHLVAADTTISLGKNAEVKARSESDWWNALELDNGAVLSCSGAKVNAMVRSGGYMGSANPNAPCIQGTATIASVETPYGDPMDVFGNITVTNMLSATGDICIAKGACIRFTSEDGIMAQERGKITGQGTLVVNGTFTTEEIRKNITCKVDDEGHHTTAPHPSKYACIWCLTLKDGAGDGQAAGGNGSGAGTENNEPVVLKVKGTSISSVVAGKKSFRVNWQKTSKENATGYEIRYAMKKNMSGAKLVTVKKIKTTAAKITKLTPKKTYYVQVRCYKTVKDESGKNTKIYSGWSKKQAVRVK